MNDVFDKQEQLLTGGRLTMARRIDPTTMEVRSLTVFRLEPEPAQYVLHRMVTSELERGRRVVESEESTFHTDLVEAIELLCNCADWYITPDAAWNITTAMHSHRDAGEGCTAGHCFCQWVQLA